MLLYIRYTYVCKWSVRICDICIFWLTWYILDHIRFTAFQTYFLSLASFSSFLRSLICLWIYIHFIHITFTKFSFLYLFHFFPTFCSFPALFFLLSWLFRSSYCTRIYIYYISIYSAFFYHWTTLSSPILFPFSLPLPFPSLFARVFFYRLFSFIYLTQFNFAPHCKQRVTSPASSLSPPTFWTTLAGGNFATDWIFMCLLDS